MKNSKLSGRKFRRQQSIENYIVDFCCPSEKLIVELDGAVHGNVGQREYDRERDDKLASYGYKVLRFENKLIFQQLENVLAEIQNHFTSSIN